MELSAGPVSVGRESSSGSCASVDISTLAPRPLLELEPVPDVPIFWPRLRLAAEMVENGQGVVLTRVPKRTGGLRVIAKPSPVVSSVLSTLLKRLQMLYPAPSYVHGFVRGRSIQTNAIPHIGKPAVLKLDLKDFFSSVSPPRARQELRRLGMQEELLSLLERVAFIQGGLPAGFRTSPTLANVAFLQTDRLLSLLANERDLTYTRYADDLTFSGKSVTDADLISIVGALNGMGWVVNVGKTRFMRSGHPQIVTGLSTARPDGPHVPRPLKRKLRQQIYFLSRYGYRDCLRRNPRTWGQAKVFGVLEYIQSVEGVDACAPLRALADTIDFQWPHDHAPQMWDEWVAELDLT